MPSIATYRSPAFLATSAYAVVWLGLVVDWMAFDQAAGWVRLGGLLVGLAVSVVWLVWCRGESRLTQAVVGSVAYVPLWAGSVVIADWLVWDGLRDTLAQCGLSGLYLIGLQIGRAHV